MDRPQTTGAIAMIDTEPNTQKTCESCADNTPNAQSIETTEEICGFDVVPRIENDRLRRALQLCIARAGIHDPIEACQAVIKTAKEALDF